MSDSGAGRQAQSFKRRPERGLPGWRREMAERELIALLIFAAAVAGAIGLFVVLRRGVLWYWKVDRIVALLERIEANGRRPDP